MMDQSVAPAASRPRETSPAQSMPKLVVFSIVGSLMATMLLQALFQTVLSTALPKIIISLHGLDRFTWVMTAYFLGMTAIVPIVGRLSDQFGAKRFLLLGVVVFIVGTLMGGFAHTMDFLIVARAVQGIGGGMGMTLVMIALGELFTTEERGRWQGMFGATFGLASIVGPTVGGWFTDHGPLIEGLVDETTRWRWIFFVMVPVGVATFAALWKFLPATPGRSREAKGVPLYRRVDFGGAVLITGGTVAFLLALMWGGQPQYGWGSTEVIGLFAAAAVLLAAFGFVETRVATPLMPLSLFNDRSYIGNTVIALTAGTAMMAIATYMPLFMQNVLGMTATSSGATITPMMLSFIGGATLCGFIVGRFSNFRMMGAVAGIVLLVGGTMLVLMTPQSSVPHAIVSMVIAGLGIGATFPLITLLAQASAPKHLMGAATANVTYFRSTGQVMGVAVVGTIVTNALSARLGGQVPMNLAMMPPEPLGLSIIDGFWVVVAAGLVALLATALLRNPAETIARRGG
jgi:EmrB/QacA subfamily drug resistance transporter